ncbi:3-ketoacyl-reductase [Teratosphaeria nubilosa]|uniref:3-ketoacyl-reductase n=1 Tax=Teratosphaeria nubilosa TaxID=161662 RepID=A0A6G1L5D5_9PEZI|nr:3-ketoacyl-reductase [Teratosphaeria nubilosa]
MASKLLSGKIAVVTGSSAGIGRATVQLLLSHGAKVAAIDINEPLISSSTPEEEIAHFTCDVTSNNEVVDTVDKVLKKWGRIDILINNAGVTDNFAATADINDTYWRKCFAVNVDGPMHFMRACIPQFLKQDSKGCILNMCSLAAVSGAVGGSAYTASKHALLGLSRSTAWMYANTGIKCNALCPGGVLGTDIFLHKDQANKFGWERSLAFMQCVPAWLDVSDLMPSILYLVTAPRVNGAELVVDGGLTVA